MPLTAFQERKQLEQDLNDAREQVTELARQHADSLDLVDALKSKLRECKPLASTDTSCQVARGANLRDAQDMNQELKNELEVLRLELEESRTNEGGQLSVSEMIRNLKDMKEHAEAQVSRVCLELDSVEQAMESVEIHLEDSAIPPTLPARVQSLGDRLQETAQENRRYFD